MAQATITTAGRWRLASLTALALAAGAVGAAWVSGWRPVPPPAAPPPREPAVRQPQAAAPAPAAEPAAAAALPDTITFPRASWPAAGVALAAAAVAPLEQLTTLTGKITLNEDRVAHIYPLVDGRVDEVNVSLGDAVTTGQQMAVIQSREAGQAMLQLAQDRLQLSFARRKDAWTQSVATNTQALIDMLRAEKPIEEVEAALRNRPLGDYRDKLMSASIAHATSRKNLDRLVPLKSEGLVAARQIFEAEAAWTTARATLQSLLEQIEQDAKQAAVLSAQSVQELETRVAVDETALKILGFTAEAIATIDPRQGEALAHCPIHSPFDGTVISKDVVLLEHVGPDKQILGVADLSTVWLAADVYEEHLRLLRELQDRPVRFRSDAWPGEVFEARIFYTGDIVDPQTRTISMRAVAANAERKLKPGMFVTVELPPAARATVLQVPAAAVLEHEGKPFVFVHLGGDEFARRAVVVGRHSPEAVEIRDGIAAGDEVVVAGGFALKSRLLSALLAD
jgi:cobalt-zinc-cadmium efflux system membrane fusion protein